ncbi:hypothetical protein CUMW_187330 [Citrus unshiu]|nr:hypothetical protein CUMW_187330 [Citrus unshiu]
MLYQTRSKNSQKHLNYSQVLIPEAEIFSDMKIVETTCAGNDDCLEGRPWNLASIVDDNVANDVNLDLLVIPQYGRNIDQTG